MFFKQRDWMATSNSQNPFLKDKHSIYSIKILSSNQIGIINMWVKDCIIDSFQWLDIDKMSDLKSESICSIQFYCNTWKMMFPILKCSSILMPRYLKICRIESFSTKSNHHFTVNLLFLVFKNYDLSFLHI